MVREKYNPIMVNMNTRRRLRSYMKQEGLEYEKDAVRDLLDRFERKTNKTKNVRIPIEDVQK